MIKNLFITGYRFAVQNSRIVVLNILGLSIGLFTYLMADAVARHERSYDTFFADAGRIYGVYTHVTPASGFGVDQVNGVAPVVATLMESNVAGIEASARYIERRRVVGREDRSFYESVKFVDPAFLEVFNFEVLAGDLDGALQDGSSMVITREAAERYFESIDVVGQTLVLASQVELRIEAVIEDLPLNSHFSYRFGTGDRLQILAPAQALEMLGQGNTLTNWLGISDKNRIYIKLFEGVAPANVASDLSGLINIHANERGREVTAAFGLRELTLWNATALEANGISLISVGIFLAGLVLFITVLNYSNLFTAIVIGRMRELALRKTLGASKLHLALQLYSESLLIITVAVLLALAGLELVLPTLGAALQKDISLQALMGFDMVAHITLVILMATLLSVAYPVAVLISVPAVRIFRGQSTRGKSGARIRSALVITQFAITGFLVLLMITTLQQNRHMVNIDPGFNGENIIIVKGLGDQAIARQRQVLEIALTKLDGVISVSAASQQPYEGRHNTASYATTAGDSSGGLSLYRFDVGFDFFTTYQVAMLSGRMFDRAFAEDVYPPPGDARSTANILINQSAARKLGFANAGEAQGQVIFPLANDSAGMAYAIVGVVEDANFLGLTDNIKPAIFRVRPAGFRSLAIRTTGTNPEGTLMAVNQTWKSLFPDLPVLSGYLADDFAARFAAFAMSNQVLMALSLIAITIAVFGLFGLVSLFAERRRKEIGIRKVLGASVGDLYRFLCWQFTRPVVISLLIGVPLGYFASSRYLMIFTDRVSGLPWHALGVSVAILGLAIVTVVGHVWFMAHENPVCSLRYE